MSAETTRRVRITVEATMRPASDRTHLQLVDAGHSTFLLDPDAENVTVEDIAPERAWTDGDVVQHAQAGWTLTREYGKWWSSRSSVPWDDGTVTARLEDTAPGWGHLEVLRYQAGEQ